MCEAPCQFKSPLYNEESESAKPDGRGHQSANRFEHPLEDMVPSDWYQQVTFPG